MNSDELSQTIMHQETRTLIQLKIENLDSAIQKNRLIFSKGAHDEREMIVDNSRIKNEEAV